MPHDAFLRRLEARQPLTDLEKLAAAVLCANTRRTARRNEIISEGATPEVVHILMGGWAARYNVVHGARRITAILLPGDVFARRAMTGQPMDDGVTALTDCVAACVSPQAIEDASPGFPALAALLQAGAAQEVAALRRWLSRSGRSNALEAISHLMCELQIRVRAIGLTDGPGFELPMTQEELGDATGLTSVHVNRTLRQLREEGIATVAKGRVIIHDPDALRRAGRFDDGYLRALRPGREAP